MIDDDDVVGFTWVDLVGFDDWESRFRNWREMCLILIQNFTLDQRTWLLLTGRAVIVTV